MAFIISTTTVTAPSTFSASPGATLSPTSAIANTGIEFTVTVTNDYGSDNIDNVILIASGFTQPTDLKPTTWDLSERTGGVRFDAIGDNVITPGSSETFVFLWTTPNIAGDYMISVLVSKEEVIYTSYENLGGFIVTIEGIQVLTPRAPIYIDGNAGFTAENGVVAGSGTAGDPYIIEGWDIDAENANGIMIMNTTAYFIIRNCYVHDERYTGNFGIFFRKVINGTVDNNLVQNNGDGIYLYRSDNNLISNNIVENNQPGIRLSSSRNNLISNNIVANSTVGILIEFYSENNLISNNIVENNESSGIKLYHSDNNLVSNNLLENDRFGIYLTASDRNFISNNIVENMRDDGITLSNYSDNNLISNNILKNNRFGIYLTASDRNFISNNIIENNSYGILLEGSDNNLISNNIVKDNPHDGISIWGSDNNLVTNNLVGNNNYGIRLDSSDNNLIYHNNIINNTNQADDDSSSYWDNGYPSGGNYWSDYTGADNYQGENQDIPGSDGIGDPPYVIPPGYNRDRYPLMNPWSPVIRGVEVSISPSHLSGAPGETLTYTVTVANRGVVDDTYDLTVTDTDGWSPSISPSTFTLAAGASGTATLTVTIPSGAADGATDTITVTATSRADPVVSASASCTATAEAPAPKTIRVPADYPTIQDAINAASDGDIVLVAPGTYFEHVFVKSGVRLRATGHGVTVDGSGGGYVVEGDINTEISGFMVTNGYCGIMTPINGGGSMDVTNNVITNCEWGIYVEDPGNNSPIINNVIINNSFGIRIQTSGAPVVKNNIIVNNSVGIFFSAVTPPSISYNNVWNNNVSYDGIADLTGVYGNISVDPLFLNSAIGDYHLQAGSPCIDKGDNNAPSLPSIDFEGNPRIIDGDGNGIAVVDMGAYEFVPPPPPGIGWDASITATFSGGSDDAVFGVRPDATPGFDIEYDIPEPPPPVAPPYVRTFFYYPEQTPDELHRSCLAPENLMEWPLRIEYADSVENVTLTWSVENIPTEYNVLLYRGEDLVANMRAEDNYTFEASTGSYDFRIVVGTIMPFTLELTQGWNMISLPVVPENPDPDAIFEGAYYVMYRWDAENRRYVLHADSGDFVEPDPNVETGVGYWIFSLENRDVIILGVPLTQLTLNLRMGWNMVGSLYRKSSIADPIDDPDGSVLTWAFTWDASQRRYKMGQLLEPGKGYWAYALGDCSLNLSISKPVFKIAIVYDIGGRGDMSFNDMAYMGGKRAEQELGVELVEMHSMTEADYIPNLRAAARDSDTVLVVGVGFLLTDALLEVAQEYPDKNFAGIDTFAYWAALDAGITPPPNMMDIVYEEHKGSALVGALGALLAIHYDKPYIGGVFGIEIPVLWKFEIAYKWGAEWAVRWYESNYPSDYAAEPSTSIVNTATDERVLYTYTGTFNDITKGYEAASVMYDEDAVAVFNIAGPLGLGINQAVDEIATAQSLTQGPPFWIGVDANQDWINPGFVIASMMKRADYGVYYATELVRKGLFRDAIAATGGWITLGIGTTVLGLPMEGISVSTLADLDEFIEMGLAAEERTGESVLPMSPDQIRSAAAALRAAQPDWIWTAVGELEDKIRAGDPIADLDGDGELETVPAATTQDAVDSWRDIFG